MRLTSSREVAPIALTENTSAYNVQVTRDAYTMYSAVRVVGGDGKGQYEEYQIKKNGVTGLRFERISDTVIRSRYPLFSINTVYNVGSGLPSNVPAVVKVGFKGIDDDDPSCQALMNYGGYEITLKEGYSWLDITPDTNYIQVNGNLLIQIYSRLVDSDIAAQIRSQRGGTGIIEYVIEDDSITDFSDARHGCRSLLETKCPTSLYSFLQNTDSRVGDRASAYSRFALLQSVWPIPGNVRILYPAFAE